MADTKIAQQLMMQVPVYNDWEGASTVHQLTLDQAAAATKPADHFEAGHSHADAAYARGEAFSRRDTHGAIDVGASGAQAVSRAADGCGSAIEAIGLLGAKAFEVADHLSPLGIGLSVVSVAYDTLTGASEAHEAGERDGHQIAEQQAYAAGYMTGLSPNEKPAAPGQTPADRAFAVGRAEAEKQSPAERKQTLHEITAQCRDEYGYSDCDGVETGAWYMSLREERIQNAR